MRLFGARRPLDSVLAMLIGATAYDFWRSVRREGVLYERTEPVTEARWDARFDDWLIDHPDDLPDDESLELLRTDRYSAALKSLGASFRTFPVDGG